MRARLDVNVLLALLDSDHVNHLVARRWLEANIGFGWASCAITQNGFVRILSQPKYPGSVSPFEAASKLATAADTEHHAFWDCSVSLVDRAVLDVEKLLGPRQITDSYLLALAVHHDGRFVTFDRSVVLSSVPGADADQLIIL